MANPIPPSLFKELIASASGSVCDKLKKLLTTLPERFYAFYSWKYLESGEFSDEFKDMLCAACGPCTGGPNNPENCSLGVPTLVAATDGTSGSEVTITWAAVAGATYYDVYRSTSNSSALAVKINTSNVTGLSYSDTFPASNLDVVYYYFIKAVQTDGANINDYCQDAEIICTSDFSNGDSGYAHSGGGSGGAGSRVFSGGNGIIGLTAAQLQANQTVHFTFQVPEGKTSLTVKVWGGGGAAGYGAGSGGGGGAEKTECTLAVTALETLGIIVGCGGNIGYNGGIYTSYNGVGSHVYRTFGTPLISAGGGGAGQKASAGGAGGAGGTGGVFGAGTSGTSSAAGNNGAAGPAGLGGAAGVVNGNFGKGGSERSAVPVTSFVEFGYAGRVEISWT